MEENEVFDEQTPVEENATEVVEDKIADPSKSKDAKGDALHTFSGYENVAKENLETVVTKFGLQNRIFDIIIPMESVVEEKNGKKKVIVNFERPTEDGFDSARCELPEYIWTEKEGYSDAEISFFEELLRNNAHLLYKYAGNGGIQIA